MNKQKFTLCIVYVSEAIREPILDILSSSVLQLPLVQGSVNRSFLLHSFRDTIYNRTSFFIAGKASDVQDSVLSLCRKAFEILDFKNHYGTHPTLGSVDNICFSPLGDETLENVSGQAVDFSAKLYGAVGVPVYLYGQASLHNRSDVDVPTQLKDIRRKLGYFEDGSAKKEADDGSCLKPSFGTYERSAERDSKGVSCVGAVPYIQNLNICYGKESPRSLVVKVTAAVRIPNVVEALTLPREEGCLEVACNLRSPLDADSGSVLAKARLASESLGLTIQRFYSTGPSQALLEEMLLAQLA